MKILLRIGRGDVLKEIGEVDIPLVSGRYQPKQILGNISNTRNSVLKLLATQAL